MTRQDQQVQIVEELPNLERNKTSQYRDLLEDPDFIVEMADEEGWAMIGAYKHPNGASNTRSKIVKDEQNAKLLKIWEVVSRRVRLEDGWETNGGEPAASCLFVRLTKVGRSKAKAMKAKGEREGQGNG